MDVGEAKTPALEEVGQALMVNAEQMEEYGVKVKDVDGVLDDVIPEFARFAVDEVRLDPAAGHPNRETARVMIASVIGGGEFALGIIGASKFAAPDDERIVQQTALFQILHQGGAGTIRLEALLGDPFGQVAVLVPTLMKVLAMSTIAEIEAAIERLPAPQVDERAGWLERLRWRRTTPPPVESWLKSARGAAIPGVTTANLMTLTRSEE